MLWHALLLAHQPHDNTYGLAATPDGQTIFVDSRPLLLVVPIVLLAYATSSWTLLCRMTGQFAGDYSWRCEFVFEYDPD